MRRLTRIAALSLLATATVAPAQIVYDWDGETSDDWFETTNWTVFGNNPDPGFGVPEVPNTTIRVEIFEDGSGSVPAPVIRDSAAEAGEVRIGRGEGAGSLTIESGSLSTAAGDSGIKFRVGNGGPATFSISGGELNLLDGTMVTGNGSNSTAQVNVTGGVINIVGSSRDLNMDEGNPAAGSNLTMSDGTINIGDVLLVDGTATIDLSGGIISSIDDFRIRGDGTINVSGGSLMTQDEVDLGDGGDAGGTLNISGGLVRGDRFSFGPGGLITIDGDGVLQVVNAQESVSAVEALITGGSITGPGDLVVTVVDIGGVDYTQVAAALSGLMADFNGDGTVDLLDLDILGGNFGNSGDPTTGDANGDGVVDLLDLDILGVEFGMSAGSAVPEPASALLVSWLVLAGSSHRSACRES